MLHGNSQVYGQIRSLRRHFIPTDAGPDTNAIVDMSSVMHSIYSDGGKGLAERLMLLRPTVKKDVDSYVTKPLDSIENYMFSLKLPAPGGSFGQTSPASSVSEQSTREISSQPERLTIMLQAPPSFIVSQTRINRFFLLG
jgi:hypothetical protein